MRYYGLYMHIIHAYPIWITYLYLYGHVDVDIDVHFSRISKLFFIFNCKIAEFFPPVITGHVAHIVAGLEFSNDISEMSYTPLLLYKLQYYCLVSSEVKAVPASSKI